MFDREFKIEYAPEAFRLFSDHKLVKAIFRFDRDEHHGNGYGNENGHGEHIRNPLEGEPVRKRTRRAYEGDEPRELRRGGHGW